MKEDCCSIDSFSSRFSERFELLTETNIGSRAVLRIARAPGDFSSPPRSTLKLSYASRISDSRIGGILAFVIRALISWDFSCRSFVSSILILLRMSFIGCSSLDCFKKKEKLSVVITKA